MIAARKNNLSSWKAYQKYIKEHAVEFGLSRNVPEGYALVRVLDSNDNLETLAGKLNESSVQGYSKSEQGIGDAKRIESIIGQLAPNAEGKIDTEDNFEFIKAFLSEVLPPTELANAIHEQGDGGYWLSQEGEERLQNALFAYAYGDERLLGRLAEATDESSKNVITALRKSSLNAADLKHNTAEGATVEIDVIGAVKDAVSIYDRVKRGEAASVAALDSQTKFEGDFDSAAVDIAKYFESHKRGAKDLTSFLNRLYAYPALFGDNSVVGSLFGAFDGEQTVAGAVEYAKSSTSQYSLAADGKIETVTTIDKLKNNQYYEAAKNGDYDAGFSLVSEIISGSTVARSSISKLWEVAYGKNALIVPVT
jgi:hypothetical protein